MTCRIPAVHHNLQLRGKPRRLCFAEIPTLILPSAVATSLPDPLGEVAVTRNLFAAILDRIAQLA